MIQSQSYIRVLVSDTGLVHTLSQSYVMILQIILDIIPGLYDLGATSRGLGGLHRQAFQGHWPGQGKVTHPALAEAVLHVPINGLIQAILPGSLLGPSQCRQFFVADVVPAHHRTWSREQKAEVGGRGEERQQKAAVGAALPKVHKNMHLEEET